MKDLILSIKIAATISLISGGLQFNQSLAQSNESLLWSIEGNGLENPSYLFGTVHLLKEEDFEISEALLNAMEVSNAIFMEVKLDDISAYLELAELIKLPEGTSLKDIASPEQYEKISSYVIDSLGSSMELYNGMKPFALNELLINQVMGEGSASYELWMMEWSTSNNKPLKGLESIRDQMGLFDSIPDSEELDWIIEYIDRGIDNEVVYDSIIKHYKQGELGLLYNDLIEGSPEIKKYEELFLFRRNQNWIPVMEAAMKNEQNLFAVGAGHLPGEFGVLELLRKQGYILKPIEQ